MTNWSKLLGSSGDGPRLYEGAISRIPDGPDALAWVTLEAFDDEQEWGPCPWPSRTDGSGDPVSPAIGDRCVVGFGETANPGEPEPWILVWWPYE